MMYPRPFGSIGVLLFAACALPVINHTASAQNSSIDSLTGPVTANEISTFKTAIASKVPSATASNHGNNFAYGNDGDLMEACGFMFDVTNDLTILDKMILYCDKVVQVRNSTKVMWTGNIDPVWQNDDTNTLWGCEQGDVAGHLAFCAQLIAGRPSIWNTNVGIGDPNGYGATYKSRAKKYLQVVDETLDLFYAAGFIHADERMITPGPPLWTDPNSANDPVPWNQQAMVTSGMIRGTDAHEKFADGSTKITKYRNTAKAAINYFFGQCVLYNYTKNGLPVTKWSYTSEVLQPGQKLPHPEDTAHGGYDIALLFRAYHWLPDSLNDDQGTPIANTLMEVVKSGSQFFNHVDGTGDLFSSMKVTWGFLAKWRTDVFPTLTKTGSQRYADVALKLWIKNARDKGWPRRASTYVRIVNRNSGKALAVLGASTADGAKVVQSSYTADTTTNDEWQIVNLSNGWLKILNRNSGKALNVNGASTADGANVIQWPYSSGGSTNDEWQVVDIGGGYCKILNRNSGKALNVSGASTAEGTQVVQWTYTSAAPTNDDWQILSIP